MEFKIVYMFFFFFRTIIIRIMVKTHAQRQKEYIQRLKEKGDEDYKCKDRVRKGKSNN